MVLRTDQFVISASLNKTLRKVQRSMASDRRWQVRFDFAFEQVMREFAAPRSDDDGTWIAEDIVVGYRALHRLGYAHSSEVWLDRKLVGGAYGVSIGQMFYGESMFTRVSDASKIALAYLVHFLRQHGVTMIDCQQQNFHLASLGAAPIPRDAFLAHFRQTIDHPKIHHWRPLPLFAD